jgi:hypothetical protein
VAASDDHLCENLSSCLACLFGVGPNSLASDLNGEMDGLLPRLNGGEVCDDAPVLYGAVLALAVLLPVPNVDVHAYSCLPR